MNRPMRRGHVSPPPPSFGYGIDGPGKDGGPPPPQPQMPPGMHPQDYDDHCHPQGNLYDFIPPQPAPHQQTRGYIDPSEIINPHHPYPVGYRDPQHQRLQQHAPYRSRDQHPYSSHPVSSHAGPSTTPSAPYKILCITNINPKVADVPVKEALINEFSRFGDISVSICHDSGERLAYIYFRSYEEAREARHTKTRTLLFDRHIDIEPIYDPRASSPVEPQSNFNLAQQPEQYTLGARRSMTPPDYYDGSPIHPSHNRRPNKLPPQSIQNHYHHHRELEPNYHPYQPMTSHLGPHPQSFNPERHYPKPPFPTHDPPYEPYRPYPSGGDPYVLPHDKYRQQPYSPIHQPPYQHNLPRDRERPPMNLEPSREGRSESYHRMDQPDYPSTHPTPHSIKDHRRFPTDSSPIVHNYLSGRRSPYSDHPPPRIMGRDFRREKYGPDGYNNNNIEPEEGRPSRILFVTNIDQSKTEEEIRKIFSTFGSIESLDLREISNSDISSCLIRFSSMDCAYRAKTAMSGKYLTGSKKPLRVAYGKVSTSQRLWIGGLGSSTTVSGLRDEFEKFGNIVNLDYVSGRPYAYVEYEVSSQAQFATHHLKGTIIADSDRKIRIEYVDSVADKTNDNSRITKNDINNSQQHETSTRSESTVESWSVAGDTIGKSPTNQIPHSNTNSLKRSLSPTSSEIKVKQFNDGKSTSDGFKSPDIIQTKLYTKHDKEEPNNNLKSSLLIEQSVENNGKLCDIEFPKDHKLRANSFEPGSNLLNKCNNIARIIDCCPTSWSSQLVLRNFNFPCKLSLCSGKKSVIDRYIINLDNNLDRGSSGDSCPVLKITQRWRLNPQPKLEEVQRKMQTANLGILIITPAPLNQSSPVSSVSPASCMKTPQTPNQSGITDQGKLNKQNGTDKDTSELDRSNTDSSTTSQARPLKNLISYLEQKDAAGVISLTATGDSIDTPKLLYAFPPGEFALKLLRMKAENLGSEVSKEEFLLGVIV